MRMHVSTSCATGITTADSGLEEVRGETPEAVSPTPPPLALTKQGVITRKGRPNTRLSYLGLQTFAVTVKQDVTEQ